MGYEILKGTVVKRMQKTLEEALYSDEALEYASLANLVHFYEEELLEIQAGKRVREVFTTSNERSRLIKHGVLNYGYDAAGRRTYITDVVKRLLEESVNV